MISKRLESGGCRSALPFLKTISTPRSQPRNTIMSTNEVIAAFTAVLQTTPTDPMNQRGRKIEAFTQINPHGERIILHAASHYAYARRLRDFKYLLGLQKGLPLDNLSAITNKLSGSFRLPLHLFLHHCLPAYPGKEAALEAHRSLNAADKVMNSILDDVESTLDHGKITDRAFAARLLDDATLIAFATNWLNTARLHR